MLTTDSHTPDDTPYIKADLADEDGIERAFQMQNSMQYTTFLSPWMRIPPDPMDNVHNAIAAFTIPKSFLERQITIHIVAKDETQATNHAMPNIFCGSTDSLDDALRKILFSPANQKQLFDVSYSGNLPDMAKSRTRLELACYP